MQGGNSFWQTRAGYPVYQAKPAGRGVGTAVNLKIAGETIIGIVEGKVGIPICQRSVFHAVIDVEVIIAGSQYSPGGEAEVPIRRVRCGR